MTSHSIQNILPFLQQPSRYLGGEINTIRKDPDKVNLSVALAFPDMYEIGTSHFGLQILYHLLNQHPEIAAERVYAPAVDMAGQLQKHKLPLTSLENHRPLKEFDLIGFSLLYELNYTNVLYMLDLAGVPFRAAERSDTDPLIIAGGPCTCNPEPVAVFFDAIVIGDGEVVMPKLMDKWLALKRDGINRKKDLLTAISDIEGIYLPSFYEDRIDSNGKQRLTLKSNVSGKSDGRVVRAVCSDLNKANFPDTPIVPYGKPIHDRLRLEIGRGCTRGCRYCQAGMIYRPVRERRMDDLMALTEQSLKNTGYADISLLSLSTGDYSCIDSLLQILMLRFEKEPTAVSLPSFRAGSLKPELMELIKKVRKTGFTIAPEAGSQRLRDVINKCVTEEQIVETVHSAFNLGWQVIKLYFMVGLPTETAEDRLAIVKLVDKLRRLKTTNGRRLKINVSVATFIPKPHTPFQWASQLTLEESHTVIDELKRKLNALPGVQFKWQHPDTSILEGLFARGDRRLAATIESAYQKGCRFDGWSDQFRFDLWQKALQETGVDIEAVTSRSWEKDEPLPWDHIDTRISKTFLQQQWDEAMQGILTADCRQGECAACGVCDFERIAPRLAGKSSAEPLKSKIIPTSQIISKRIRVLFSKTGPARFFGHLELVNIFMRALKRARIELIYSQGFHPKPKVVFDDPLPIGVESEQEAVYLTVPAHVRPDSTVKALDAQLPEGLKIIDAQFWPQKLGFEKALLTTYSITSAKDVFSSAAIKQFNDRSEFVIAKRSHKGKTKRIDIKTLIVCLKRINTNELTIVLCREPGRSIRPTDVLTHVFELDQETIQQTRIVKKAHAATDS